MHNAEIRARIPHGTQCVCAAGFGLCAGGTDKQMKRIAFFIVSVFRLHSISLALWVDAYTAHKPTHGGK